MTAQAPDWLENRHPTCSFEGLEAHGVLRPAFLGGAPGWRRYVFARQPRPPVTEGPDGEVRMHTNTGLRRGHVAELRLEADGRLTLVSYVYPWAELGSQRELVNEELRGDFWLDLRPGFYARALRVPFVDGRIVTDRSRWRPESEAEFRGVWFTAGLVAAVVAPCAVLVILRWLFS